MRAVVHPQTRLLPTVHPDPGRLLLVYVLKRRVLKLNFKEAAKLITLQGRT